MEADKLLKMEEDLADAVYLYGIEASKAAMAEAQALYIEKIGSSEGFDRWAVLNAFSGDRPLLEVFMERSGGLSDEKLSLAKAWRTSTLGVYEAGTRTEEGLTWFSDVVSGERRKVKTGDRIGKGDLLIGRLLRLEDGWTASAHLSVSIDRKLADTVKGKLRRAYEAYCGMFGYVTYRNYMESNPWILPKLMAATEAAREITEEGVPDVHVRVYALVDRERVMEAVDTMDIFVQSDKEKGIAYYLLMEADAVIGEIEIHRQRLVLNANSNQEAVKADKVLKTLLGSAIAFLEKRTESLEDLAGQEGEPHVGI